MNNWIALQSGRTFDYLSPTRTPLQIEDIAVSLSRQVRYVGHTTHAYTVAHHCCLVSDRVSKDNALWGLLHDAAEAVIGDIPKPFKSMMPAITQYERMYLRCIAKWYDLPWPMPAEVKAADEEVYWLERTSVSRNEAVTMPDGIERLFIDPWNEDKSYQEFMSRYERLNP